MPLKPGGIPAALAGAPPEETAVPDVDHAANRLHVQNGLAAGAAVDLGREASHYLATVLRLAEGDAVLLFNGRDGEWRARIAGGTRKSLKLVAEERTRPQPPPGDLRLLFAPLKHARLDYLVQKAVEMGASCIRPVLTRYTQVSRVNLERMRANVVEAAEQCGILSLPAVEDEIRFEKLLERWDPGRRIVFCDEAAPVADPLAALAALGGGPLAVLVGPEGGFAPHERDALLAAPWATPIALGPRILRADTAAVAALALVQSVLGDWRG
jgi:16S rRNA (uracil1498-N3)-methyltransferase